MNTKTKQIVVERMKVTVPDDIWFNTSYAIRGRLKDAKKMTMAQFITTSNATLRQVFGMMSDRELKKFSNLLHEFCDSKRSYKVLEICAEFRKGGLT